jgi:hypothetical protein
MAATATPPVDRLDVQHETDPSKIKEGDIMAFQFYGKVLEADSTHEIAVHDLDNDRNVTITGSELIASAASADQVHETVEATKTEIAQKLVDSANRPFTVVFKKVDGSLRRLRGRLIGAEPLMGYSKVEDLDNDSKDRFRQVNHRDVKSLTVDGVCYTLKSKKKARRA